ncbi:MAG: hypothetical protein IIB26_01150, partial [Chloroflexi bacterium]|nr:hypothetical protein [Chloroflexota bacterium]
AGAVNAHWSVDGGVIFVAIIAAVGAAFAVVAPMGRGPGGAPDSANG